MSATTASVCAYCMDFVDLVQISCMIVACQLHQFFPNLLFERVAHDACMFCLAPWLGFMAPAAMGYDRRW